jgi:hypothetical protein
MIFGNREARPINWLKTGTDHARRIGRVRESAHPEVGGTGFLLDGGLFDDHLRELPFFLTSNHVVGRRGDDSYFPLAIHYEDAFVVFEGMFDDDSVSVSSRFDQVLASSSVNKLNYTLLLLDRTPGAVTDLVLAPQVPQPSESVFVIGYPGHTLSVSLEDNEVLGGQSPELYYRAPTKPGSSGSLVLNQYWEAVAMHQGGPKKHNGQRGNFGTNLQAIIDHARTTIDPLQISESAAKLRATRSSLHGATPRREAEIDEREPDFFSVFISYSHNDSAFALRLYNSLQSSGVRAWMDKHQMLPGDDIYEKLKQGIRGWDKLLLCCSRSSLLSWWVDNEIDEAFQKERELFKARGKKVMVLIPIDLDGYLFEAWSNGKAQQVKSRLAANFQGWTAAPSFFDQTFQGLLRALRIDSGVRELPPPPKL